jgi:hypothetical protein
MAGPKVSDRPGHADETAPPARLERSERRARSGREGLRRYHAQQWKSIDKIQYLFQYVAVSSKQDHFASDIFWNYRKKFF